MVSYRKLALLAAGLLGCLAVEAQASPFTSGTFVTYQGTRGGQNWRHGAGFLIHFVTWREDNPQFTVTNISWVDHWAGDGGAIVKNDGTPYAPGEYGDETIPPWKDQATIPEPGTALLVGSLMSLVALRRRTM